MTNPSDIASIERATLDAVCPAEVHEIPGWLLPYDTLPVGRARSAVPPGKLLRHALPLPRPPRLLPLPLPLRLPAAVRSRRALLLACT